MLITRLNKEGRSGQEFSILGDMRHAYKLLVGKCEEIKLFERYYTIILYVVLAYFSIVISGLTHYVTCKVLCVCFCMTRQP